MNRLVLFVAAALSTLPLAAQMVVPPGQGTAFHDTKMLVPPPGVKVAIYEFEDLECPACARAYPVTHEALKKYNIPLMRHDFPLPMHRWSKDAAITARYLQDKVSPALAEQYRGDVFHNQTAIASKDDLNNYTRKWFAQHGQQMPFVMDPNGLFAAEVNADYTLGERIGLVETPTIFVVTQHGWIQIKDMTLLYSTLDNVIAQESKSTKPVVTSNARKPKTTQQ
jgi:protein-disulfide isomerase